MESYSFLHLRHEETMSEGSVCLTPVTTTNSLSLSAKGCPVTLHEELINGQK